jgi:hypothetical protein
MTEAKLTAGELAGDMDVTPKLASLSRISW